MPQRRPRETFWNLTELPARLVILGGGAIGCGVAQAVARLGSAVTLVHRGPCILPREEARASAIIHSALVADGVDAHGLHGEFGQLARPARGNGHPRLWRESVI